MQFVSNTGHLVAEASKWGAQASILQQSKLLSLQFSDSKLGAFDLVSRSAIAVVAVVIIVVAVGAYYM